MYVLLPFDARHVIAIVYLCLSVCHIAHITVDSGVVRIWYEGA